MITLIKLYEERLRGVTYNTEVALEDLLVRDERIFYFVLMYFYLTNYDLSATIRNNVILCNAVTIFCLSCGDAEIYKYYNKYVMVSESIEQVDRIYKELQIAEYAGRNK